MGILNHSERMKRILKYLNISANKLSKELGYTNPDIIYHVIRGRNAISHDLAERILSYCPDISMGWLASGSGGMIIGEDGELKYFVGDGESDESLPLIPFDCIAGYGEDNEGISLNNCEHYKIPEFKNLGAEFLVRVGGSSMYPKYSSGDILACRKIHDILFFQWGKIYVIDSSQGQLIKRVLEHEDETQILLVSDNSEKYPPFTIPKNDIRSLSIVLGAVRME